MRPLAPSKRVVLIPHMHTQFGKLGQLVRVILPPAHTRVYVMHQLPTTDRKGVTANSHTLPLMETINQPMRSSTTYTTIH